MSLFSVLRDPIRLPQVGWIGSKRWANRVSRNVDISHESNTFPQINVFLPTAPTHLSWYHSFPLPWQWIQSPRLADLGSLCFTLQSSHEVSFPSSSYVSDDSDDDVDGFTSHLLVTCLLTFCWGNSFLLLFFHFLQSLEYFLEERLFVSYLYIWVSCYLDMAIAR